jgi:pantoate kinase
MRTNQILKYLGTVESATLRELYENSDYSYYANWRKHFGDVMSRLIKQGFVVRVKPGVFRLNESRKMPVKPIEENPNQIELF